MYPFGGQKGIAKTGRFSHTFVKEVRQMRITLHIGPFTVTILVKRRNRHPAR